MELWTRHKTQDTRHKTQDKGNKSVVPCQALTHSFYNKKLKNATYLASILFAFSFINQAHADDFGCEALLCFAGGKNVSECQPTIKKVIKDMAKGKPFPHCSFVTANGKTENDAISANLQTIRVNKSDKFCPDGVTKPTSSFMSKNCKAIKVEIKAEYTLSHQAETQYYYYN